MFFVVIYMLAFVVPEQMAYLIYSASACTTRVGHGIGYMTHEAPYINAHNRMRLRRGMCFSVEPGIYLPGRLGMRIEDIVAIDLDGRREILNRASKDLISIGRGGVTVTPPRVC